MTCCAGRDGCDRPDVVMPISCCYQMDAARLKLDGWVSSEPLRDGSPLDVMDVCYPLEFCFRWATCCPVVGVITSPIAALERMLAAI
ncbi:hypothetical protein ACLOJK_018725 [Asimina triloba]